MAVVKFLLFFGAIRGCLLVFRNVTGFVGICWDSGTARGNMHIWKRSLKRGEREYISLRSGFESLVFFVCRVQWCFGG